MKLVSFINSNQKERLGIFHEGKYFDLCDTAQSISIQMPSTMCAFLTESEKYMPMAQKAFEKIKNNPSTPQAKISKMLAPVPHPTSCRDAYAFRQHVSTMRKNRDAPMSPEFDQFPVFYFTNHNAIMGEGEVLLQPDHFENMDYELEVAIVIGKKGRNILAADADDYILGYTIMNDLSARKLQLEEMKLSLGPAKGKDFATTIGPWLVTKDELESFKTSSPQGDRFDLRMNAKINGKMFSEGNMNTMHWTFAQILERVSYGADIFPGDVIGSGTVGTGCLAEINGTGTREAKEKGTDYAPVWLQDGDEIALQIEGLGTLTNTLKRTSAPYSLFAYKK